MEPSSTSSFPAATSPAHSISAFLRQNRFALIGVSREGRSYSRGLFRAFLERGYNVVPVNPSAENIGGLTCHGRISEVQPPVTQALVLVAADQIDAVLAECAASGLKRLWLPMPRKLAGRAAVNLCRAAGMDVIYGYCPLMFLEKSGAFHHFHGWLETRRRAYREAPPAPVAS